MKKNCQPQTKFTGSYKKKSMCIKHWLLIHVILLTLTIMTQLPEQNSEAAAGGVFNNFEN